MAVDTNWKMGWGGLKTCDLIAIAMCQPHATYLVLNVHKLMSYFVYCTL